MIGEGPGPTAGGRGRGLAWIAAREVVLGAEAHRYERHRPEQTLLYQLVEQHYPALVAMLAAEGREVPAYVAREFEEGWPAEAGPTAGRCG